MTLEELDHLQAAHLVRDAGVAIAYIPKGDARVFHCHAIRDRNAAEGPAYGVRERPISQNFHQFTFIRAGFPYVPAVGDELETEFQQEKQRYRVEHVNPDDDIWWTVTAR